MRMSSAGKKGEKGKVNSSAPMSSKEPPTNSAAKPATKVVEFKSAEASKTTDQLNPKLQPTAEQLRIAQMISDSKRDDPELPDKVNKLVELTNCSADAAVIALHDANNDLDRAIAALLDGTSEGDWEVSGKKRKPKQPIQQGSTGDGEVGTTGNGTGAGRGRDRDRSRSSRGGPPRLRGRGRGRDNKENLEDTEGEFGSGSRGRGSRGGPRMSNGPGREGSAGRGGGRGGRGFRRGRPAPSAETWEDGENSTLTKVEPWGVDFPSAEDWDNEEYIGSLVETKVFTPSQSASAPAPVTGEPTPLINGSSASGSGNVESASQVLYSTVSVNNSAQQVIDLNALLQNTTVVSASSNAASAQQYLHYTQQATDALKAAMGVGTSTTPSGSVTVPSVIQQQAQKTSRPQRAKIPPPSKIPLSAVEMPDDSLVSGLDVKFGTLDFGIEPSGFEIGLEVPSLAPSATGTCQSDQKQQQPQQQSQQQPPTPQQQQPPQPQPQQQSQQHGLMAKMDQYGNSGSAPQPPAPSALPKPDSTLGAFTATVPSAAPSMVTTTSQVKPTNSPASYPYGSGYTPGVSTSTQPSAASQPAGAYPSTSQTSSSGVYSNSTGVSSAYPTPSSQSTYGTYTQQQQQSTYQTYNNKLNATSGGLSDPSSSVSSLRVDLSSHVTASSTSRPPATTTSTAGNINKPTGASMAPVSSSLPNMPPGVPTMLGPGGFIMGQAPGLPYYAAAAAGIQQHPVYSLEDMQFRYPHLTAGYFDMGYQSPTSLGTGRDGTLASLAYAGSDAKFPRNDNNSPVPTSLSQNAAQSHGGAFITPAPAAATALPPAYAYYYSGGVMPGGYQFGAPALYPVSAAASGHAGSGAATQYGKGGPLGGGGAGAAQSGQTTVGSTGGGPSSGTASYASYGSSYDEFSKSVYGSVGVGSAAGQAAKIGGVGASGGPSGVGATGSADLSVGPNVYGKSHSQLGKINTYDKAGGFHTGTPPPYGLAGNATGAPLGVGVSVGVGVGGPSPYGAQHMFIPTLAPHQSQHSHLNVMHQQLHQDSSSGPGQRSQSGGQQNKPGSKPTYGGSYWGSN